MEWFAHVLVAVFAGFGMAIVLVEKKEQWPATAIRPILSKMLGLVYHKLPDMLECSVCTSFWTALLADLYLSFHTKYAYVPCWPLSGFMAMAVTWTVIETMNAIDPK